MPTSNKMNKARMYELFPEIAKVDKIKKVAISEPQRRDSKARKKKLLRSPLLNKPLESDSPTVKLTVYVPAEYRQKLKLMAAELGTTLTALVVDGVRQSVLK